MIFTARRFFTPAQKRDIADAIARAESRTSGEIRVRIEAHCGKDIMARAQQMFRKIGMHKTAERNGVLFYLAVKSRQFAVVGDEGIHKLMPASFWDTIRDAMENDFRAGRYAEGLIRGIGEAARQLQKHFPHDRNDRNELSNEISFG